MKKYSVSIPYHATYYVNVQAKNPEEAKIKALEGAFPQVCCHCSKSGISIDEYNDQCEIDVEEVR